MKKIIDEHGGRVHLSNSAEGGARVTLVFPIGVAGGKPVAAAAA